MDVATQGDSSVGSDGASDSGQDSAEVGSPFCTSLATKPLLCEDFDSLELPGAFFESQVNAGGSLVLDKSAFVSGSRSLAASVSAGASDAAECHLVRNYASAPTVYSLGFSVRIDKVTQGSGVDMARLVLGSGNASHHLILGFGNRLTVGEQFGPGLETFIGHSTSQTMKVGDWARIEVTLNAVAHTLVITLNGVVTVQDTIDSSWVPASQRLQVGISYSGNSGAGWGMHIDDVVYDAK